MKDVLARLKQEGPRGGDYNNQKFHYSKDEKEWENVKCISLQHFTKGLKSSALDQITLYLGKVALVNLLLNLPNRKWNLFPWFICSSLLSLLFLFCCCCLIKQTVEYTYHIDCILKLHFPTFLWCSYMESVNDSKSWAKSDWRECPTQSQHSPGKCLPYLFTF